MTMNNYMDYAKSFGYDVVFTGLGMAYITLGSVKLTETKDLEVIENELAFIGMAIMSDTIRATMQGRA